MFREYGDRAHFVLVYIREAHPDDGWQVPKNTREGVVVNQPKTDAERDAVAHSCVAKLSIDLPTVVDDMKDSTEKAYGAWPDRLFVVGADGKLVYRGGKGPRGFLPAEAEKALRVTLGLPESGGVAKPKKGGGGRRR